MKYYAIADLHGRFDLLEKAFERITQDCLENPTPEGATTITLGDYIDRGPQSKQIIDKLIDRQDGSQLGSRLVCLKGNHEDMAVQVCSNPTLNMQSWWIGNGGAATFKSYAEDATAIDIDHEHIKWMANLPLYLETEKQVFVHAGIPDNNIPLEKQDSEKMMWMLYNPTDMGGYQGKHVVHGHHQFADGPHEWKGSKRGGRTDLDCWAYHTGRLVIGVFDDTQGPALKFLEVTDGG